MSSEYANQAANIIAEAMIESAKIYADTLHEASHEMEKALIALQRQYYAEKKIYEEELARLQQEVENLKPETGQKPSQRPAVTPSARPEVKPEENQQSSMPEAFKEMYATLRDLSIEQRQAKAERSMKKFKGKRKHATSSDAQRAVSRNSVELRILWTILTGRGDFKGIENTGHPLHKHIDKINEYKRKCGQAELKVEAPAKETGKKPAATPVKVTYGVRVDSNYDKLPLIKVIKEIMAIGLKEAKDIVDNGPVIVPGGMTKADAEALIRKLKEKGYVSSVIVAQ